MEAAKVAEAAGPTVSQVCAPTIERTAKGVGWLKVLVGAAIACLAAGAFAALYVEQYVTRDEVTTTMKAHESGDGHPTIQQNLKSIDQRLIRVEMLQQSSEATQRRIEGSQERMDDKLDRLLSSGATWRMPPTPAPQPTP